MGRDLRREISYTKRFDLDTNTDSKIDLNSDLRSDLDMDRKQDDVRANKAHTYPNYISEQLSMAHVPLFVKRSPAKLTKNIFTKVTPPPNPGSAWSDSDGSESDYGANSVGDSDTDVEGCQSLPKYADLTTAESPKSSCSQFTVQPPAKDKQGPRADKKPVLPILTPSETVMERYAPLEWSTEALEALKSALDKRQRVMQEAGLSHFIQIQALHNCLEDVAFGVNLRGAV